MKTCDKNGVPFEIGDILKVFHYVARVRRENIYMYKQIVSDYTVGNSGNSYFKVNHLELNGEYYLIKLDEGKLEDYEVVQSLGGNHRDRVKVT